MLHELGKDNSILRIDAEFFDTYARSIDHTIRKSPHFLLKTTQVVSGPFGSTLKSEAYLKKRGIPFVRIENIKNGFYIDTSNIVYISNADNDRLKNSQLDLDDLVLSKVGNIGCFARVNASVGKCNISENNIGIKLRKYTLAQKHYILTYLNTIFARNLVLRRMSGNVQPKLNVDDVCYIPIPQYSETFYKKISSLIVRSELSLSQSTAAYAQAENLLLSALNMQNFTPPSESVAVKTLSESFSVSGRLDSEYYQEKYDSLLDKIKTFHPEKLGNIATIRKSIEPGSACYGDEGVPFVRVSDINKYGISDPTIKIPQDIVPNMEELYPRKDTILLSKDGSVGIAYKVEEDKQFITSGALLHLNIKHGSVLPDYLTLVLNSPIVQLQAERDAGGSIIQHWKPSEIAEVLIPVIDMQAQSQIAALIQSSFTLRKQSEHLLETAKHAVEIAIEQGEDKAMEFLAEYT